MNVASVESSMSHFAHTITTNKYAHDLPAGRKETWPEVAARVVGSVVGPYLPQLVDPLRRAVESRKFMPGGRYLYAAGRKYPQVNNCFLFSAEDSREGWSETMADCCNSLMTGGGIGVVYSKLRPEGANIIGMGGKSTGPLALMRMVNECGRYIVQGGSRRSAIWAGLHWNHPDVFKLIHLKDWSEKIHECRREDFTFPAPMDGTNVSIILDDHFFAAYHDSTHQQHTLAYNVYWEAVEYMLRNGEPGFSVDCGENEGEHLRNACTEVTSRTNRDMCNLASVNLARISTIEELAEVVELGTAFLLCGTLYSKLPVPSMYKVREQNRRLGLGLMGLHEWMLRRGMRYEPSGELAKWMEVYKMSTSFAHRYADQLSISRPVATRAVAPTGTISIVAETTSGVEPVFAVAYKRRYLDGSTWKAQYVVDAAAQRLIDTGVDPMLIEDAFTLAEDVGRRVEFQVWLQRYVDHGISSTINVPTWGSSLNNVETVKRFGQTLIGYLPGLRGVTVYPEGSRGGQPLVRVNYRDAVKHLGSEFVEGAESTAGNETDQAEPMTPTHTDAVVVEEVSNDGSCRSGVCGA